MISFFFWCSLSRFLLLTKPFSPVLTNDPSLLSFPLFCPFFSFFTPLPLLLHHYHTGQAPTGESVADLSGGGFSNYFERPSYQDDAVAYYIKQGGASLPDQKMWNATGKVPFI